LGRGNAPRLALLPQQIEANMKKYCVKYVRTVLETAYHHIEAADADEANAKAEKFMDEHYDEILWADQTAPETESYIDSVDEVEEQTEG
jgi:hypothetical protein